MHASRSVRKIVVAPHHARCVVTEVDHALLTSVGSPERIKTGRTAALRDVCTLMGANPARVPSGPKAGFQLLKAEEDAAFTLLNKLDPQQRARATINAQPLGNIISGTDPVVAGMLFASLPAGDMTADQQQQLRRLLGVFAGWMSDSSARSQLQRIDAVGFERLHFSWAGAHQPREGHYFRIHGPTVLVEYDNSSSNHIHSVWPCPPKRQPLRLQEGS